MGQDEKTIRDITDQWGKVKVPKVEVKGTKYKVKEQGLNVKGPNGNDKIYLKGFKVPITHLNIKLELTIYNFFIKGYQNQYCIPYENKLG